MQEAARQGDCLFYLDEEYEALVERLRELEAQQKKLLKQFGQMRGAQLYDINSERAELQRDAGCTNTQIQALRIKLLHARIAPAPVDDGKLGIGKFATLVDENDVAKEWLIVGPEGTDRKAAPPRLAYTAPCLDGLYGQVVGASNSRLEIAGIRMPEPALRRKAA